MKRLDYINEEAVPDKSPVLVASSHSNSFIDGGIIAFRSKHLSYILARGDAFNKPFFNWVLRSLHLLPIFRSTDASPRESIKKNTELLDEVYKIFERNAKLTIFSEAIAVCEKNLRPIRKGTARMAIDIMKMSDFKMDLYILPTGVNYTHFGKLRSVCMTKYGEAIRMQDYVDDIKASEAKTVRVLTKLIEDGMGECFIKTERGREEESEVFLEIARKDYPSEYLRYFTRSPEAFNNEKRTSIALLKDENKDQWLDKAAEYIGLRDKLGLKEYAKYSTWYIIRAWILLILTLIPSLVAAVLQWPAFKLTQWVRDTKIKKITFRDSVHAALFMITSQLLGLIYIIILFFWLGWQWALAYVFVRWFIRSYWRNLEFVKEMLKKWRWKKQARRSGPEMDRLLELRREIAQFISKEV